MVHGDGPGDNPAGLASRPVLIFDLGGVVLDWNPRHLFRAVIADGAQREWFLTEVCSTGWNAQMDAGKPSAEAVAELSGEYPEHAAWIRAYWDRWPEMLGGLIPGMAADCLFSDAVAAIVDGARAAGLAAVQFTSAAALRRLLAGS